MNPLLGRGALWWMFADRKGSIVVMVDSGITIGKPTTGFVFSSVLCGGDDDSTPLAVHLEQCARRLQTTFFCNRRVRGVAACNAADPPKIRSAFFPLSFYFGKSYNCRDFGSRWVGSACVSELACTSNAKEFRGRISVHVLTFRRLRHYYYYFLKSFVLGISNSYGPLSLCT